MERTPLGPPPLIYAHRGDRSRAPDNTLEAYRLAVGAGSDGIELDVRQTSDGVLIMSHDDRLDGHPPFSDVTFRALRDRAPHVPTFAEALAAIPRHIFVNVEVKNQPNETGFDESRDIVEATLTEIRLRDDLSRILISSFDPVSVTRAVSDGRGVLSGQLITDHTALDDGIRMAVAAEADALHPPMATFALRADEAVQRIHEAGLRAVVWNANTPVEVSLVAGAGVDVIITDDPQMARDAL
jgi:glycerophosphoryl diester phosphodiesterase